MTKKTRIIKRYNGGVLEEIDNIEEFVVIKNYKE
jgi:hypothetical protein